MSGGPTNLSSSSGLPPWAASAAQMFLSGNAGGFPGAEGIAAGNINRGYPSGLNYQVAPLSQDQNAAISATNAATPGATGIASMGAGQLGSTLAGDYLSPSSNPWLAQTAAAADQSTVNAYNLSTAPSAMAQGIAASGGGPGSLAGSSAFQQTQDANQYSLATSLGNTNANIYGTNYANERQNQVAETGLIPQTQSALYAPANQLMATGGVQQNQSQNQLNAQQQNAAQAQSWPWQQLNNFASIFAPLTGGFSLGTQTNPGAK